MNDDPNAAPPPGALFDNTPTWYAGSDTATVTKIPAHLTPAARVCQDRGGRWFAADVYMQYGAPIPLDLALKRVQMGRTVFVARGDAAAVVEAGNNSGETLLRSSSVG